MQFCQIAALVAAVTTVHAVTHGPDYESLPLNTLYPGPWENNIRAPINKSHIVPVKVFNYEGAVTGQATSLRNGHIDSGASWSMGPGGLITLEFGENIAGRVCFDVESFTNEPYLALTYSESSFFAGRESDTTDETRDRDLALYFSIERNGTNCVAASYNRGGFKYLTVVMPEHETEEGFWHEGHKAPQRASPHQKVVSWYELAEQKVFGWIDSKKSKDSRKPRVTVSGVFVNCTSFPSNPNGRAYTGYFDSSSSLLNRVWYAGAYTLQLSTLDPREGSALISYNRHIDHNTAPDGSWYSNFTIANGSTVTTDGAKRDRVVWPGDMTIAIPGIAVSTYDMLAVRNALNTMYDHRLADGSMPYAGLPLVGDFSAFSDTYHLHTLIGTYLYVLYSGDLEWLRDRWTAYVRALEISINKVDEHNLLYVTSPYDWIRPGMRGRNVEASALLYEALGNSILLSTWLDKKIGQQLAGWKNTRDALSKGIASLYCEQDGLFSDNDEERGCNGVDKVLPQDGNSWALLSNSISPNFHAFNVSENLRKRWVKVGAPAVEFPNVISPFASSFELLGHIAAGNSDAAVELIELMWGYMLDGPGMTNSTLLEGYRTDGYIHYPAFREPARTSHAHGWAAGPTTALMQGIIGINLNSPLGRTWTIKPHLTKWLEYARGGFATKLGKFEVEVSRMRTLTTHRRVEVLKVSVPTGTSGIISWGGNIKSVGISDTQVGHKWSLYRYVDGSGSDSILSLTDDMESSFVRDDTWVKPIAEKRPDGVIDWAALKKYSELGVSRLDKSLGTSESPQGIKGKGTGADTPVNQKINESKQTLKNAAMAWAERVVAIEQQLAFG